ncbi:MAG: ABC transporter permease, partial [Bacteroidales bacterium]|nr:ABC transporter permease [Bacteroidales bacterium]
YAPQYPWEYSFMDDEFTGSYDSERKMAKIILCFTLLSIFVSALGLFGLAAFMAHKRTKEIGIRKVHCASIPDIIILLTKDFTKYVIIGFIPAAIIAGILMTRWLQNFAYHTALSWWIFASAGLMALVISILTVAFQAYRAASRNPVESLRYE